MDYDPKLNTLLRRVKDKEYLFEPNLLIMGILVFLN